MTTEFLKPSKLQCPIFLGFLDSYCICIVCQENLSYQIVVRVCHICIVRKKMYRTKAFLLTFISVTLEHNDYHTIHVCYTIQWNNLTKTIYSLHCLAYYITMLRKLYLDFCFIILIMNICIVIFLVIFR